MATERTNYTFYIDRQTRDDAVELFEYLGFGINAAVSMLLSRIAHSRTIPLNLSLYIDPAIPYSSDKVKFTIVVDKFVRENAIQVSRSLSLGNTELMEHFINECLVKQAIPFAVRK